MSHKPDHITGELANVWDELYGEAQEQGVDPETQPIRVTDVSRSEALDALAAVGGAVVTEAPGGGRNVLLSFKDEEEEEGHGGSPNKSAAKRHTFATE